MATEVEELASEVVELFTGLEVFSLVKTLRMFTLTQAQLEFLSEHKLARFHLGDVILTPRGVEVFELTWKINKVNAAL